MIAKPTEETLQKKKIESEDVISPDLDPELLAEQLGSMEKTEEDVYGEIKIRQTPEAAVLGQIEKYKEDLERERGEVQKTGAAAAAAADDAAMAANDDNDDDDSGVPVKYYGYQIPKRILDNLGVSTKIDLEKSDDWLKIWLARVMEKVS